MEEKSTATAALVCGILAIVFSGTVVVGVVLGIVAIVLAGRYLRSTGIKGKASAGKICGIIGIALSVCALVAYLVTIPLIIEMVGGSTTYGGISGGGSTTETIPPGEIASTEADQQEIEDYTEQLLRSLKNLNQEEIDGIALAYNDQFAIATGFPLTEAGVDPASIVQTSADSITYEPDQIFFTEDGAVSYVTVTSYGVWDYIGAMSDELSRLQQSGTAPLIGADSPDKVKVGELFLDTMDNATPTENYLEFKFTKTDGVWEVESQSYNDAASYIYQTY